MRVYVLTPLAKVDIFDVWTYLAEASETAARGESASDRRRPAWQTEYPARSQAAAVTGS
jgi:plasmid stabilization system protein ParE